MYFVFYYYFSTLFIPYTDWRPIRKSLKPQLKYFRELQSDKFDCRVTLTGFLAIKAKKQTTDTCEAREWESDWDGWWKGEE